MSVEEQHPIVKVVSNSDLVVPCRIGPPFGKLNDLVVELTEDENGGLGVGVRVFSERGILMRPETARDLISRLHQALLVIEAHEVRK
jgi:hypothetical protein